MEKYSLYTLRVTVIGTNCYILVDNATRQAAVIDPGASADRILAKLKEIGATLSLIIDTHGHWDHIGANQALHDATGAPILIHALDAPLLGDRRLNCATLATKNFDGGAADRLLKDGDVIDLGELRLTVIHTPGHTPGGICLRTEDLLFTGDTLFYLSMGRTDLEGGDEAAIMASLARLSQIPEDLRVLPGHETFSTLAVEKKSNPFMPHV